MIPYILGTAAAMGLLAAAVLRFRRARRTLAALVNLSVPQRGDKWADALSASAGRHPAGNGRCPWCADLSEDPHSCTCKTPCEEASWCVAAHQLAGLLDAEGGGRG